MIMYISTNDLRRRSDREGLIIQGCGGDFQEWVDGINALLTEAGILINGSKFENVSVFEQDGVTNLLFDFEGVDLNIGKFALWRLQTYSQFGGTWLSDYVPNKLGGFVNEKQDMDKPDCPLIGEDGNIFNLIGIAARTLRSNGMDDRAKEMQQRITGGGCQNYYEALNIIGEYVNITSRDEQQTNMEMTFGGM